MAGCPKQGSIRCAAPIQVPVHRYWTLLAIAVIVSGVDAWHITGSRRKHSIKPSAWLDSSGIPLAVKMISEKGQGKGECILSAHVDISRCNHDL